MLRGSGNKKWAPPELRETWQPSIQRRQGQVSKYYLTWLWSIEYSSVFALFFSYQRFWKKLLWVCSLHSGNTVFSPTPLPFNPPAVFHVEMFQVFLKPFILWIWVILFFLNHIWFIHDLQCCLFCFSSHVMFVSAFPGTLLTVRCWVSGGSPGVQSFFYA